MSILMLWSQFEQLLILRALLSSFHIMVNLICGSMDKRETIFWKCFQFSYRVAINLWRLVSGSSTRNVAEALLIGQESVVEISNEFCETIFSLKNQFISFRVR